MPTHYQGGPEERLALDAFIKLQRCADSVTSRLQANIDNSGLTYSQFGVMEALFHLGPLRLCDVARKILRSGGNITMVARNLEKQGLVRRRRDPHDQRAFSLELTLKGADLIRKVFARHARAVTKQFSVLSAPEQSELGRLCKRLGLGGE